MNSKILGKKKGLRTKRKLRIRSHCNGTIIKPRITVFRSNRYFYAQAIDDLRGYTLAALDSRKLNVGNTKSDSYKIGTEFANILLNKNIKEVVFDRNGYLYHGVVASFADGLRSNGIVL